MPFCAEGVPAFLLRFLQWLRMRALPETAMRNIFIASALCAVSVRFAVKRGAGIRGVLVYIKPKKRSYREVCTMGFGDKGLLALICNILALLPSLVPQCAGVPCVYSFVLL